jgi:peptidoglycan/xylan/chitin deacetylase (PgdA/CDA1 family)
MRAILTYHSIDDSGSVLSTAPATFRSHIQSLARGTTRVVALDTLLSVPAGGDAVAITFDDGFLNFATEAWPVLRDHGFPATLFVVTDRAGGTNDWNRARSPAAPELPLLGWDALGALAEEGVQLGGHGRTHADLRRLAPLAVADEVGGAAARIRSETGVSPAAFAYPFGSYTGAVAEAVRQVYAIGCTTELRPLRPREDPCLLPRLDAYYLRSAGSLDGWGSTRLQHRLWVRDRARRFRQRLMSIAGGS